MKHRTFLLLLMVVIALEAGVYIGWRARVSTEEVIVHPLKMRPPVPDNLSVIWP